jgi:SAM-dependent methyltransferase
MIDQQIKEKVKERYGKIALAGNSEGCCTPTECCGGGVSLTSPIQVAKSIGYDAKELESVPESSILGVGCGAPVNFADIHEGETVVDIGSGGGIDVFLAANKVKAFGKAIGIDMTDEILEKAQNNAKRSGFANVEFKKGDIERGIPIEDSAADVVISNCVINLTLDKVAAFKEIYRILRYNGRMVISDLVTNNEVGIDSANSEEWCSCIDGALTKKNYMDAIRKAGFKNIEIVQETPYIEADGRKITSLVIKTTK